MRIYALVEGRTESRFVQEVLAPHLAQMGLAVFPIQVRTSRDQRGGVTSFPRVERELSALMKQHSHNVCFTTMFDFYALPTDFPGNNPNIYDPCQRAQNIEAELAIRFPDRLIPYIQLHEFEALLFTDLNVLPPFFPGDDLRKPLSELAVSIRHFDSPEQINDKRETSPSHRLAAAIPAYHGRKADVGPAAVARIGLPRIRAACPHFHHWLQKLEALANP
jgi:hypothetical protein